MNNNSMLNSGIGKNKAKKKKKVQTHRTKLGSLGHLGLL
jgi:hypothetical protein